MYRNFLLFFLPFFVASCAFNSYSDSSYPELVEENTIVVEGFDSDENMAEIVILEEDENLVIIALAKEEELIVAEDLYIPISEASSVMIEPAQDPAPVIIAAVAKDDIVEKNEFIYKQTSKLDRNAIQPRGYVKVGDKLQNTSKLEKSVQIVPISSIKTTVIEDDVALTSTKFVEKDVVKEPSLIYQLETFYFDDGSSHIKSEDMSKINEVVKLAKEKNAMIYVLGYSSSRTRDMDYVTHKMTNFKISLKRAENMVDLLMKKGLKENQVLFEALSDTRPAYLEVMPEGERLNRRVEIYIGY